MTEAVSEKRSRASMSATNQTERKSVGRRIAENVGNVSPLAALNKLALAGMFGSLIEGVVANNSNGLIVAVALLVIAGVVGGCERVGSYRS